MMGAGAVWAQGAPKLLITIMHTACDHSRFIPVRRHANIRFIQHRLHQQGAWKV